MESVSLPEFKGFDWDEGNPDKNRESHKMSPHEAEQLFFNHPLIVADDVKHSGTKRRYFVLGQTQGHDHGLTVAYRARPLEEALDCFDSMIYVTNTFRSSAWLST